MQVERDEFRLQKKKQETQLVIWNSGKSHKVKGARLVKINEGEAPNSRVQK